jgi:hypothetical protein
MQVTRHAPPGQAARALAAATDPDALAATVTRSIATEVWPEQTRDPDFLEAMSLSVRDNVRAIVALFAGTLHMRDTNPAGAFGFADLTAEMGIPVSELENAYWVGVHRFWEEWFALSQAAAGRGEGTVEEFVGAPTHVLFEYIIHILGAVVARYDATREEIVRNREDRRRAVLNQILDGSLTQPTQELENVLGYRLRGTHLGLALELDERVLVERVVGDLVERTGAQGSLLLLHGPVTWVAWLGFAGSVAPDVLTEVGRALTTAGAAVAVGTPGAGIPGLRRTHDQALEAARLRRRYHCFPAVLWFADVRLEALMVGDEAAAHRFVTDELGELAAAEERADRTRETLLEWLTTGSQARAAARLGVHENTVRLRIRHAEQVIPDALAERPAAVLVALRLRQMLGPCPEE